MSALQSAINEHYGSKPDMMPDKRETNIERHYTEQVAKGRMALQSALRHALHDLEGWNRHDVLIMKDGTVHPDSWLTIDEEPKKSRKRRK